MSKVEDGGPAFPVPDPMWAPGLSLRDWFAGQATATVAAMRYGDGVPYTAESVASRCYEIAYAMLEARKK